MKIVADDKIPYIEPCLRALTDDVVMKPGQDITADDVRNAHILVVRTRTRCDASLLSGSSVFLVATATIGYDHLDTRWLEEHGIAWANCPGCNASSVGQYVNSSLLQLQRQRGVDLKGCTLGIVGVGHVGTAVLRSVTEGIPGAPLGLRKILLCDPPRQQAGDTPPEGYEWCSLERIREEADIITLHTPLTREGDNATWHLLDDAFFEGLHGRILINAARGGIVDEQALLRAMSGGAVSEAVIDTWENEPHINEELLRRAFIATPHIAGYSADGKANATRMTLRHICRFFFRPMDFDIQPPSLPADFHPSEVAEERALQLYDPCRDSERLKASPETFEWQRGHYPLRREMA